LWLFSSILSPTAEKPAPTRSPTVLSESFTFSLLASYDAPLVVSTKERPEWIFCFSCGNKNQYKPEIFSATKL
jgi:hypothetical protein